MRHETVCALKLASQEQRKKEHLPPPTFAKSQITSRRRGNLVHAGALLPRRALALDDGDNLLCDTGGEHGLARGPALALAGGVEDPGDGCAAALAETERNGDLQGDTATGGAAL